MSCRFYMPQFKVRQNLLSRIWRDREREVRRFSGGREAYVVAQSDAYVAVATDPGAFFRAPTDGAGAGKITDCVNCMLNADGIDVVANVAVGRELLGDDVRFAAGRYWLLHSNSP